MADNKENTNTGGVSLEMPHHKINIPEELNTDSDSNLGKYIRHLKNRASYNIPYNNNPTNSDSAKVNRKESGDGGVESKPNKLDYLKQLVSNNYRSDGYDNPIELGTTLNYGQDVNKNKYLPASYSYLSPHNTDNLRGYGQSRLRKASYGLSRIASTAVVEAIKTSGIIAGASYGAAESLYNATLGDWEDNDFFDTMFNNPIVKIGNDLEQYIDEEIIPVHMRDFSVDGGIIRQITSMDNWATTGAAMAGYAAMMYGPGALFNYAKVGDRMVNALTHVRGAKNALKAAEGAASGSSQVAKSLETMNKSLSLGSKLGEKGLATTPQMINRTGETLAAIIADAGNEALSAAEEYEENQRERLYRGEITEEEFDTLIEKNKFGKVARNTFLINFPIQVGPKFVMSKLLWGGTQLGRGSKFIDRAASSKEGKLVVEELTNRRLLSEVGKGIGLAAARSTYELPTQIASRNLLVDNPDLSIGEYFSELIPAYLDALGSTEGQQAIFYGQMTGLATGTASRFKGAKATHKATTELAEIANRGFSAMSKNFNADVLVRGDNGNPIIETDENGKPLTDSNGNPVYEVNADILKENLEIINELGFAGEVFEAAAKSGDLYTIERLRHAAQLSMLRPFIDSDMLGIDLLKESLEYSENLEAFANETGVTKEDVINEFVRKAEYLREHSKIFDNYGQSIFNIGSSDSETTSLKDPFMRSLKEEYLSLMYDKDFVDTYNKKLDEKLANITKDENITTDEFKEAQRLILNAKEKAFEELESRVEEVYDDIDKYDELIGYVNKVSGKGESLYGLFRKIVSGENLDHLELSSNELNRMMDLVVHLNRGTLPEDFVIAYNSLRGLEKNSEGVVDTHVVRIENDNGGKTIEFKQLDSEGNPIANTGKSIKNIDEFVKLLTSISTNKDGQPVTNTGSLNKLRSLAINSSKIELLKLEYNKDGSNSAALFRIDGVTHKISNIEASSSFMSSNIWSPRYTRERLLQINNELSTLQDNIKKIRKDGIKTEYNKTVYKEYVDRYEELQNEQSELIDRLSTPFVDLKDLGTRVEEQVVSINKEIKEKEDNIIEEVENGRKELFDKYSRFKNDSRLETYTEDKDKVKAFDDNINKKIIDFWNADKANTRFKDFVDNNKAFKEALKADAINKYEKQISDIKNANTLEELEKAVDGSNNRKIRREANKREKEIKKDLKEAEAIRAKQQEEESTRVRDANEKKTGNPVIVEPDTGIVESFEPDNDPIRLDPNLSIDTLEESTTDAVDSQPNKSAVVDAPRKGGTRIIGLNNDGTKPDYISQEFADWQLNPIDKRGKEVSFKAVDSSIPNIPTSHPLYNQFKDASKLAVSIINGELDPASLSTGDIATLIDYLPINVVVAKGIEAPLATRPLNNRQEVQSKYLNNDRALREALISHLISNKTLEGFKTTIEGQYAGLIKTDPNPEPGRAAENSIRDLHIFRDNSTGKRLGDKEIFSYIRKNIRYVSSNGQLKDINRVERGVINKKGVVPSGEIYLRVPMANGALSTLKLNTNRISREHAEVLGDIVEVLLKENLSWTSMVNHISDKTIYNKIINGVLKSINPSGKSSINDLRGILGQTSSNSTKLDVSLDQLFNLFTTNSTFSKNTIDFSTSTNKDGKSITSGFQYGDQSIPLQEFKSFDKEAFVNWLTTNKRYAIHINPNVGESKFSISSDHYLSYILDNNMLNTNATTSSHIFSNGYTGIYLRNDFAKAPQKPVKPSPMKPTTPEKIGRLNPSNSNTDITMRPESIVSSHGDVIAYKDVGKNKTVLEDGKEYDMSYVGELVGEVIRHENNSVSITWATIDNPGSRMGLNIEDIIPRIDNSFKPGTIVGEKPYKPFNEQRGGHIFVLRQRKPHKVVGTKYGLGKPIDRIDATVKRTDVDYIIFANKEDGISYFKWLDSKQKEASIESTQEITNEILEYNTPTVDKNTDVITITRGGKELKYSVNPESGVITNVESGKEISPNSPIGRQVVSNIQTKVDVSENDGGIEADSNVSSLFEQASKLNERRRGNKSKDSNTQQTSDESIQASSTVSDLFAQAAEMNKKKESMKRSDPSNPDNTLVDKPYMFIDSNISENVNLITDHSETVSPDTPSNITPKDLMNFVEVISDSAKNAGMQVSDFRLTGMRILSDTNLTTIQKWNQLKSIADNLGVKPPKNC